MTSKPKLVGRAAEIASHNEKTAQVIARNTMIYESSVKAIDDALRETIEDKKIQRRIGIANIKMVDYVPDRDTGAGIIQQTQVRDDSILDTEDKIMDPLKGDSYE